MATAFEEVRTAIGKKSVECRNYLDGLIERAIKSRIAWSKLHGEEFTQELDAYNRYLSEIRGCLWTLHHIGIIRSYNKRSQAEKQIKKYVDDAIWREKDE